MSEEIADKINKACGYDVACYESAIENLTRLLLEHSDYTEYFSTDDLVSEVTNEFKNI